MGDDRIWQMISNLQNQTFAFYIIKAPRSPLLIIYL